MKPARPQVWPERQLWSLCRCQSLSHASTRDSEPDLGRGLIENSPNFCLVAQRFSRGSNNHNSKSETRELAEALSLFTILPIFPQEVFFFPKCLWCWKIFLWLPWMAPISKDVPHLWIYYWAFLSGVKGHPKPHIRSLLLPLCAP